MPPSDPLQVIQAVVRAFDALGIPYLVGGSMASSVFGAFRATQDVDFVADVREEHVTPLSAMLSETFYADADLMRAGIARQDAFNLIHLPTMYKADIFLFKQNPWGREEMARRQLAQLDADGETITFYVASPEDTILQKLLGYRMGGGVSDRQWDDVQAMLKVQAEALDDGYLRRWAAEMGISDLLDRALAAAGSRRAE